MRNTNASKEMLEYFLSNVKELSHLRVRARGNVVTLESDDSYDTVCPHVRFRQRTLHKWSLEMPVKRGWDPTFIEGTLVELMEMVIEKFPWALAPR